MLIMIYTAGIPINHVAPFLLLYLALYIPTPMLYIRREPAQRIN